MSNIWKNVSFALSAVIVGSLVTIAVLSWPLGPGGGLGAQERLSSGGVTPPIDPQTTAAVQDLSKAFRTVAEAIRPSVVSIETNQKVGGGRGGLVRPGFPREFEDMFRRSTPRRQRSGTGSGVIVRSDGYILTNNHVVENADELIVELFDGSRVDGTIVGTDPKTDLAVIKIERSGLQSARFGDSDEIQVGDWVLAIGSPFGLDQTVTAGIISGKNRVQRIIDDGDGFEDFLQTDAAINPGNSGGPLVNLRGELVGINTAILSRSGGSAGIGFAIPVALAEPVLNSIIETGEVRRGFLGAQVVDVTPDAIKNFDLKVRKGALVGGVLDDQPAAIAGLKAGDVVTQIDGRPCPGGTYLRNYVASRAPGATIEMVVDRGGQVKRVQLKLTERTDEAMALFGSGKFLGAELVPVTPETAREYGYPPQMRNGLIIVGVEDGSLAAQNDLQVGDIIESVGGIRLTSVEQLVAILTAAQKEKQPVRMVLRRGNQQRLVVVQ